MKTLKKLTTVLLAFILCLCIGCSNEDAIRVNEPQEVTFQLAADDLVEDVIRTKAGVADDEKISNYFIGVFHKNDLGYPAACEYAVYQENGAGENSHTGRIEPGSYKVLTITNIPAGAALETLKTFAGNYLNKSYTDLNPEHLQLTTLPTNYDNLPKWSKTLTDFELSPSNKVVDVKLIQLTAKIGVEVKVGSEGLTDPQLTSVKFDNIRKKTGLINPESNIPDADVVSLTQNPIYIYQHNYSKTAAGDVMKIEGNGTVKFNGVSKAFNFSYSVKQDLLAGHYYILSGTIKYTPSTTVTLEWELLDCDKVTGILGKDVGGLMSGFGNINSEFNPEK